MESVDRVAFKIGDSLTSEFIAPPMHSPNHRSKIFEAGAVIISMNSGNRLPRDATLYPALTSFINSRLFSPKPTNFNQTERRSTASRKEGQIGRRIVQDRIEDFCHSAASLCRSGPTSPTAPRTLGTQRRPLSKTWKSP